MTLPVVPPIQDADRYVAYQPVASTADFAISFPLFGDETDVTVYLNGTKLTLTTDYTVISPSGQLSLLLRPITDALVHLATPISSGKLEVYGARRPRRTVQATTAYSTRDFNVAFSDLIATMRELWSALFRAVTVPVGENGILLPSAASRAGKVLVFDQTGALQTADPSVGGLVSTSGITDAGAFGRTFLQSATVAIATALLNAFTSDNGVTAGLKGLVPAPQPGDAAASKVLGVAGWQNPVSLTFPTGWVAQFMLAAPPTGWLQLDGTTIGSASSGATGRANADTLALYTALWSLNATDVPIFTSAGAGSTRGASASADFSANKRLQLPDARARFLRGLDSSRGVDSGRRLGSDQADQLASHVHSIKAISGVNLSGGSTQTIANGVGVASINTDATGGSETRPANLAVLTCIKL